MNDGPNSKILRAPLDFSSLNPILGAMKYLLVISDQLPITHVSFRNISVSNLKRGGICKHHCTKYLCVKSELEMRDVEMPNENIMETFYRVFRPRQIAKILIR